MKITFVLLLATVLSTAIRGQDTAVITNDEFASRPFGRDLSPKAVSEVMLGQIESKKNPIKIKLTGGCDTLLVFKSADGELTFYKNFGTSFFYRGVVIGEGIRLAKGIRIGMSKSNFISTFGMQSPLKGDVVVIKNLTQYANHRFLFRNNTLVKIELDAGID